MRKLFSCFILLVLSLSLVVPVTAQETLDRTARAEIRFMEGMIDHHQMAVDMATDCLAKAESEEVRTICQSVIDAQTAEIAELQGWLRDWYGIEYTPMSMLGAGGDHSQHQGGDSGDGMMGNGMGMDMMGEGGMMEMMMQGHPMHCEMTCSMMSGDGMGMMGGGEDQSQHEQHAGGEDAAAEDHSEHADAEATAEPGEDHSEHEQHAEATAEPASEDHSQHEGSDSGGGMMGNGMGMDMMGEGGMMHCEMTCSMMSDHMGMMGGGEDHSQHQGTETEAEDHSEHEEHTAEATAEPTEDHSEHTTESGLHVDPSMTMGMMAGLNRLTGRDYDIAWLEAMIDHHDDALHMANRILEVTERPELVEFANRVVTDQTAEIAAMEALLETLAE